MYNPRILSNVNEFDTIKLTSHEIIAKNDFVTIVADGEVECTDTGDPIFGIALEAASAASVVITVARVTPGMKFLMDNDNNSTTFASTHVGGRFDITGATGAMLVDTSTIAQVGGGAETGQLFCTEYNPQVNGLGDDTSIGVFEVAEIQGLGAN